MTTPHYVDPGRFTVYATKAEPEEIAARLNAEEQDGWSYKVARLRQDRWWFIIEAYDAEGERLGAL